jgi:predicted DCC family thiol-disulfide oxidoreductase YuxK
MTALPERGTRFLRGYIGGKLKELNENRQEPVLLYDADCAFCEAVVGFILRHEKRHTLRFAARTSEFGAMALARYPELRGVDSVVWLELARDGQAERAQVKSAAVLRVASYLGGWWRGAGILRLVPLPWRDAAYDGMARHRRRLTRSVPTCRLPDPSSRDRFVDHDP